MKVSRNPISDELYVIPDELDDSHNLIEFLEKHKGKKVVVVQGLGFVGAVMSLICANAITEEYAVIGVDLANETSYWKIKALNEGVFPLTADDPKIEKFFKNAKQKGNFYATYDPIAYQYADVVIIDINLDVIKNFASSFELRSFDVDLSSFKNGINEIAQKCKEDVLILVETTVPPGTCEKVVKSLIEQGLKHRNLPHNLYSLGHSYERVMPGPNYIDSIREYPRVFSGIDENSASAVEQFLGTIIDTSVCSLTKLSDTNSTELAKVLENSYRAMNIAFVVEWSRYSEEMGINLYDIVDAIRMRNTHANLMYPGIGVGGYCLTKDPLLASWSRKAFFGASDDLDFSVNSVNVNDRMPLYAFQRLLHVFGDISGREILLFGVSYRGDVGDTRFSPVENFVKLILDAGAIVNLHDPFVSYWNELNRAVDTSIESLSSINPDIIIISTGHSFYKTNKFISFLEAMPRTKIFDTIGSLEELTIKLLQKHHTVSVLGRGDIV